MKRALDLFCGAGGATRGLQLAGFHVTGIDIKAQPRYCGDTFIQADACNPPVNLDDFDIVWPSPPCQGYVGFNKSWNVSTAPKLVEVVRELLAGHPLTVIENVVGAPLLDPGMLCGSQFGLRVRRHRLFETSFFMFWPKCAHDGGRYVGVYGDHPQGHYGDGYRIPRARSLAEASAAMGIDWMPWKELTQSIPPLYSEFIGRAAMRHLADRVAA